MRHCLVNMSRPVSEEIVDELYCKACEMARLQRKRMRVSGACRGVLRTEWKRASLGTMVGYEFTAEVVDSKGDLTATFIVQRFEPDDTVWVGHQSLDEAEEYMARLEAALAKKKNRLN